LPALTALPGGNGGGQSAVPGHAGGGVVAAEPVLRLGQRATRCRLPAHPARPRVAHRARGAGPDLDRPPRAPAAAAHAAGLHRRHRLHARGRPRRRPRHLHPALVLLGQCHVLRTGAGHRGPAAAGHGSRSGAVSEALGVLIARRRDLAVPGQPQSRRASVIGASMRGSVCSTRVVTQLDSQAASWVRNSSGGPTSATCCTSSVGTAAAAASFSPAAYLAATSWHTSSYPSRSIASRWKLAFADPIPPMYSARCGRTASAAASRSAPI